MNFEIGLRPGLAYFYVIGPRNDAKLLKIFLAAAFSSTPAQAAARLTPETLVQHGSVQHMARFSIWLDSARLGSARHSSACFGSARLGSARHS